MTDLRSMWHWARHPPAELPADVSFKGKTVLVTGANSGLGHAAAVKYAARGASPLILAVRTQEKGEAAKEAIVRETGCKLDSLAIEIVDLARFASVQDFCTRVKARYSALHVLQLSGGVGMASYELGPEGYEMTLQVNLLSITLLALLLLPKVRETATTAPTGDFTPHISFLNSVCHLDVTEEQLPPRGETLIHRLNDPKRWDIRATYFQVKLASWFAMRAIAERCTAEEMGIVVNATCSGLCKTNMPRTLPLVGRVFMAAQYALVGRTAEQGARTLVGATALGPESHGKFWTNDQYMG